MSYDVQLQAVILELPLLKNIKHGLKHTAAIRLNRYTIAV